MNSKVMKGNGTEDLWNCSSSLATGKEAFLMLMESYKECPFVFGNLLVSGQETARISTHNDSDVLSDKLSVTMGPIGRLDATSPTDYQHYSPALNLASTIVTSLFLFISRYLMVPCMLVYLVCYLWKIHCVNLRDHNSPLPLPRGKMGFPFVGEMFHLFIFGAKYQRSRRKQYGNIYATHMFGKPTVVAIGDEHVRRLLLGEGNLVRTQWPSTTRQILGEHGIVNGDAETHTRIKRLALRALSPKYMGTYAPVVQVGISDHIEKWSKLGAIPLFEASKQMVSKTMMTILLGINAGEPDIQLYIRAADDIINSIFSLPIDLPGFMFHKGLQAREFVFKKLESDLRSKIEATDEELFDETKDKFQSLLVNILKLARMEGESEINLKSLQNLSLEFIFAGTQSLQCACASMIVHLSQHPEIVSRLRDEIVEHDLWNQPMSDVAFEKIEALKFADSVVKETLRVTPTIPGGVRVALKTFELGGYQVPRGWQVMYSIRMTHEAVAGKVLQNGDKCEFDPDVYFNCGACPSTRRTYKRNIKQNTSHAGDGALNNKHVCDKTAGDFSFIPFGKGARMCAGKNYGLLFLRLLVFALVKTTDVSLKSDLKFIEVPMTRPDKSVMVEFTRLT